MCVHFLLCYLSGYKMSYDDHLLAAINTRNLEYKEMSVDLIRRSPELSHIKQLCIVLFSGFASLIKCWGACKFVLVSKENLARSAL